MARATISLRKEGTVAVVKAGRYVESFDTRLRVESDILDAIRWVAITGGVSVSEATIRDLARQAGVR